MQVEVQTGGFLPDLQLGFFLFSGRGISFGLSQVADPRRIPLDSIQRV
jgi:hypothetical protein